MNNRITANRNSKHAQVFQLHELGDADCVVDADFATASADDIEHIDPSLLTENQLLQYTERLRSLGLAPDDTEVVADEDAEEEAPKQAHLGRALPSVDVAELANTDSRGDAIDIIEAALLEEDLRASLYEQDLETEHLDLRSDFDIRAETHCKEWHSTAAEGIRIFSDRVDAIARVDDLLGKDQNVALLVADDGVVQVVHWVGPVRENRLGRAVRLDNKNRLIYAVASQVPKRSFAHCTIVHPNVGVRMLKHEAAFRAQLPADKVKLKAKWQRIINWEGSKPVGCCSICVLGDADAFQCALCDCTYHSQCSEKICEWVATMGWSCGDLPNPHNSWVHELVEECPTFPQTLCDMCTAQVCS